VDFPGYTLTNGPTAHPVDAQVLTYAAVDGIFSYGTMNKPIPGSSFPYGFDVEGDGP